MRISLGKVEVGLHQQTDGWLHHLRKYPVVRFFGFSRGRTFIGVILGTKKESKLSILRNELWRVENEFAALKKEHNTLLQKEQVS